MQKVSRITLRVSSGGATGPDFAAPIVDEVILCFCDSYRSLGGSKQLAAPYLPRLRRDLFGLLQPDASSALRTEIEAALTRWVKQKKKGELRFEERAVRFVPQTEDRTLTVSVLKESECLVGWQIEINLTQRPSFDAVAPVLELLNRWGAEFRAGIQVLTVRKVLVTLELQLSEIAES